GSIPVRVTIKKRGMPKGVPLFLTYAAVESNPEFLCLSQKLYALRAVSQSQRNSRRSAGS
ncbi:MAG: hypothetical protein IJS44_01035, partial [Clostridia bacterium]|nr:hypothetical protein [Clostridia bacterium]